MPDEWASLVIFLSVMTGTPGPANMLLLAAAAGFGLRRAARFFCGVVLGMQIIVWPLGLGLMELATRAPALYSTLRWACAAYIFLLAWQIAQSRVISRRLNDDAPGFLRGLLVHPLNPKAWAMATGAYTQFMSPVAAPLSTTSLVASTFLVIGFVLQGLWFSAGGGMARLIAGRPMEKWIMRGLGLVTVASVLWAIS